MKNNFEIYYQKLATLTKHPKLILFYTFRVKRPGQCRIHPKLSSSSSGSGSSAASTTPPYRQVYNKRTTVSLTSSTEMYAEVYRTSSGESSRSPM